MKSVEYVVNECSELSEEELMRIKGGFCLVAMSTLAALFRAFVSDRGGTKRKEWVEPVERKGVLVFGTATSEGKRVERK